MNHLERVESNEVLAVMAREAIDGDTRAFSELVRREKDHVLANCRFLTRSDFDSEDLAQEVFVKAYLAIGRFEGRSKFSTWLRRIKINHCLSYLRSNRGKNFLDVDDPEMRNVPELRTEVDSDVEAGNIARRERIRHALDALPDSLRVPLVMCDVDGFSYEEISRELRLGLSATKMRIKRARERFRAVFDRPHRPTGRARRFVTRTD